MGVTGLWTVVAPTARPTQLATLNRKRLAVDASIWIYQFLKAVRDKEGNALRNSHVVGFFRRICKLLYFGIKPVFVFDGGAPLLKRETVRGRARRREGRREDAARTAGKLLGMQMQRAAEEEEEKRRRRTDREGTPEREEELPPEQEMVYVDEMGMSSKERLQNRQLFRKKDQYHLPDLETSIESMGAPNDPRIMSQAELEEYARQFHSGEDINLYDFSKIDFESPFFLSLPPSDRYNILNAARLRSRLRMGYSKEQLDDMFPDRMAFSRFQIERVRERNELTQRLMHVNGMADDFLDQGGRIAGEKGKEYVLVKNEGVEGGWALGVVSNKGKHEADAIDVDDEGREEAEEDQDDEEEFEDVAIEGLNRLPRRWARNRKEIDYNPAYRDAAEEIAQKRRAVYEARQKAVVTRPVQEQHQHVQAENGELFVRQANHHISDNEADELFEDVEMIQDDNEQDDLQRAIQMSLQGNDENPSNIGDQLSLPTMETQRSASVGAGENNQEVDQPKKGRPPPYDDEEDEEGGFDLQAALAESRRSKHKPKSLPPEGKRFSGPLPFESLNLGQSLLGKKKADRIEQDQAGGFEKETGHQNTKSAPLPSWFGAKDWTKDTVRSSGNAKDGYEKVTHGAIDVDKGEVLVRRGSQDVIDVDEPSEPKAPVQVVIDSSEDETDSLREVEPQTQESDSLGRGFRDKADASREDEVQKEKVDTDRKGLRKEARSADVDDPEGGYEGFREPKLPALPMNAPADIVQVSPPMSSVPNVLSKPATEADVDAFVAPENPEPLDWSETDEEDPQNAMNSDRKAQHSPTGGTMALLSGQVPAGGTREDDEHDDEFENVDLSLAPKQPALPKEDIKGTNNADIALNDQYLTAEENFQQAGVDAEGDGGEFSDSEDEELMRQMAVEAEEHVRFASSLNKTQSRAEAPRDYERELRQLRNQQKKDRRDADEVTQVMIQECQALLRLFGLPYMTAPMEAEAQCAELVSLGLVDGIVTDDSDIFLFGGTRVYKNMFNAAKFVECYLTADLEKEYALDRRKLIRCAHLLGSDYTEGIPGVGPVTALEILTDFDTLEEFRDWCTQVQMGQLDGNITTPFRKKFRKQAQKMFLPPAFPDTRVDHAYLHPDVDSDPSEFEWGVPDLDALRAFLMATIGWSQERTDEVLLPVIRDMNKREREGTQANITRFFRGGVGVGGQEAAATRKRSLRTGRMDKVFGRLKDLAENKKGAAREEMDVEEGVEQSQDGFDGDSSRAEGQRRRRVKKTAAVGERDKSSAAFDEDGFPSNGSDDDNAPRKKRTRRMVATGAL